MALSKNLVQFFFGATDQDTSKKGVKQGDLIRGVNIKQLHGGVFIKRGGFAQSAQNYENPAGGADLTSITPDSITSPDGKQVLIRDAVFDASFARSFDIHHNKLQGASLRWQVEWPVRFQALQSGEQQAPMAKQAGDYYVWCPDDQHFMVSRRSSDGETELARLGPIEVASRVKSFAVVDCSAFDSQAIWIIWIDWSTNVTQQNRDAVLAYRIARDLSGTVSSFVLVPGGETNRIHTSISAAVTAAGQLTIAVSGVQAANSGPDDYTNMIGFRSDLPHPASSVTPFSRIFAVDNTGASVGGYDVLQTRSGTFGRVWTSSGICLLTALGATLHTGHIYYAYWASQAGSVDDAELVLCDLNKGAGTVTETVIDTITYDHTGHEVTYFVGSVTGHETAAGVVLAAQARAYFRTGLSGPFTDPSAQYCDYLYTKGFTWNSSTAAIANIWTARAAWLACGWFALADGTEAFVTGWNDPDALQMPYFLRRLDTGAIIAVFARGEASYPGGTGSANAQIAGHVCDIPQPMLFTNPTTGSPSRALVALTSASLTGSVDIANLDLFKPNYSNPVAIRGLALAPGPIPTLASGWQKVCEAGPVSFPSRLFTAFGVGSS